MICMCKHSTVVFSAARHVTPLQKQLSYSLSVKTGSQKLVLISHWFARMFIYMYMYVSTSNCQFSSTCFLIPRTNFCVKSISVEGTNWFERPDRNSMVHKNSHSVLVQSSNPCSSHDCHKGNYIYMNCIIRKRFQTVIIADLFLALLVYYARICLIKKCTRSEPIRNPGFC